ncbi:MAG: RNA-binding transcriptional accessory protein [Bacteroidia bacterium]|nr:RNA-binding transcriptional accessory protein [Bacteroidia bacterium]
MPELIADNLKITVKQVSGIIKLLDDAATIPFISRYRKEMTGGLDEVAIESIKNKFEKYKELIARRVTIVNTIDEQGKMTAELKNRIENCWDSGELEDIYLPYKPKRKTKAEIARQNGLEPLAKILMNQMPIMWDQTIKRFINKEINTPDEALQGARDIIAEWISENETARNIVRRRFSQDAIITSKVVKTKQAEADNYRDYFDFSEKLSRCSSHRLLAIRRGEKEGFLRVDILPDSERVLEQLKKIFVKTNNDSSQQVEIATDDSYKRLLKPSIETEFAVLSKEKADNDAIKVFAENLRQLLMQAPLGQKRVLGIDPGFRSGCKIVCLDAQGNLLHNENIYPNAPQNEISKATSALRKMVESYKIEAIAIGNGTASRETEQFISQISFDRTLQVFVVSENGASIYSASAVAREEFPNYDVTVRGAVSIGRRLLDPLAELVKIDPKSIGVGQYQHDVDQTQLKSSLTRTVESVVNNVGVDINTASKHLLTYISGLGPVLAQNIVDYRLQNGAFKNRNSLMNVPKMGAKTFEQAAGFLRISKGDNPLDNSSVHPESYGIVAKIAADLNCTVTDLMSDAQLRKQINLNRYITDKIGMPTLTDIMHELEKPSRDPRGNVQTFSFDPNVRKIDDLKEGMVLPGIVTNITNFGAFVDIGIKENALVHISQMSDKYISDPNEVLSLHQHLSAKVLSVDIQRKRIALSLKTN